MSHERRPKVSIVVLNLNGYEDTCDCIESLRGVQYPNFDVTLVDNGSSDDSADCLKTKFPEIKLIRSDENLGFTGGNNLGIQEALSRGADYVLLLNNDTIVDPNFLGHLIEVGETDSRIGILGPKILYAAEPQRIWFAGGYVRYSTGTCGHLGHDQIDRDGKFSSVEDTGWVSGCGLLIKSAVLREVGPLDPRLFIYWEDVDLCMRVSQAGYRCVFVPMARIWHKVSRTCGLKSSFTLYLGTRNQLALVAKRIPFPYKPGALALVLAKKLGVAGLLSFKSRDSATAVWGGIWAFLLHEYGPPGKERLMRRRGDCARARV
jgi:GT2 family glycosyltransferase